jgi:hypothetical protein
MVIAAQAFTEKAISELKPRSLCQSLTLPLLML